MAESVVLVGGQRLVNVHYRGKCYGSSCPIHRPSDHHMRGWSQRFYAGMMYRVCPHGVFHIDPDDPVMRTPFARGGQVQPRVFCDSINRCDGCCVMPENWYEVSIYG